MGILGSIDDNAGDSREGTRVPSGQRELPFAHRPRRTLKLRWRHARGRVREYRILLNNRPLRAGALAFEALVRWMLRIALPLAGASAMLHLFPYHAQAGGVHFHVQATLFTRSGLSADTTIGSWEFPDLNALPIGVHISPENVDVVHMAAAATHNGQAFVDKLRADLLEQVPLILSWLAGEAFLGFLIGLAVAAAINLAMRHLRGLPRRRDEVRHRAWQFATAMGVLAVLAVIAGTSYNPQWAKQSRLTGTLAALQLFPGQLQEYYQQQATAFDVVTGIAGIQAELQQRIEQSTAPPTAFNVMFISDMHLASTYPLVREYVQNFGVKLIVNTGDESLFGTSAEMTPAYRKQIRELTKIAPMVWLAGNHDSPTTVRVMRSIPGVIVLGTKVVDPKQGYDVTAQQLQAYGLTIAGLPDPRVYGAAGAWGSNTPGVVDPLERKTASDAVTGVGSKSFFDIFATHEPAAAQQLIKELPGQIRQVDSGHVHKQNAQSDIEKAGWIDLVEGSTGAGGLKEIDPTVVPAPVEFTVESVAADCQFTKLVRFQIRGTGADSGTIPMRGQNVTASTLYLKPQQLGGDGERTCSLAQGIGKIDPLPANG